MMKSKTFIRLLSDSNEIGQNQQPLPNDFVEYLQWACLQLRLDVDLVVTKIYQSEYSNWEPSSKSKARLNRSISDSLSAISKSTIDLYTKEDHKVYVTVTCDNNNDLVQIKFDKNSPKPRSFLKLIRIIGHLYETFTKIIVEPPVQSYVPYELSKIIEVANITDVCVDGCYLPECQYHLLLEGNCQLQKYSLARCNITDVVLKMICSNLFYPTSASKSLRILNLSSNKITDIGAQHIADALRSNRQLVYLNLSDNSLTDKGAFAIFDILYEFPLNDIELRDYNARRLKYFKAKIELTEQYFEQFKKENVEKKPIIRTKQTTVQKAKVRRKDSSKSYATISSMKSNPSASDELCMEQAKSKIEMDIGDFIDPFCGLVERNGVSYSHGNNSLQILNLAYNGITYLSLIKLKSVLSYQQLLDRRPIGLLNVCLDGNRLPTECKVLPLIDELLESAMTTMQSFNKKVTSDKKKAKSAK